MPRNHYYHMGSQSEFAAPRSRARSSSRGRSQPRARSHSRSNSQPPPMHTRAQMQAPAPMYAQWDPTQRVAMAAPWRGQAKQLGQKVYYNHKGGQASAWLTRDNKGHMHLVPVDPNQPKPWDHQHIYVGNFQHGKQHYKVVTNNPFNLHVMDHDEYETTGRGRNLYMGPFKYLPENPNFSYRTGPDKEFYSRLNHIDSFYKKDKSENKKNTKIEIPLFVRDLKMYVEKHKSWLDETVLSEINDLMVKNGEEALTDETKWTQLIKGWRKLVRKMYKETDTTNPKNIKKHQIEKQFRAFLKSLQKVNDTTTFPVIEETEKSSKQKFYNVVNLMLSREGSFKIPNKRMLRYFVIAHLREHPENLNQAAGPAIIAKLHRILKTKDNTDFGQDWETFITETLNRQIAYKAKHSGQGNGKTGPPPPGRGGGVPSRPDGFTDETESAPFMQKLRPMSFA